MDTKKYLFSNKDLINLILPLTVDQYLGKNNEEMACKAANELLSFTLKAFLGVTILAYLGRNLMIRTVFGNIEQDVIYNCKVYMLIVFASIPMIALYNAGTSLFRGVPGGLENSMFQLGKILVLGVVSGFGTASIAANAVANNIASFAILPGLAMGFAMLPVAAQCVGAGDFELVSYYTKKLMKAVYLCLLISNAIVVLLLPAIIWAYGLSEEAGGYTYRILIFYCGCVVTIWPPSFFLPNTLRAAADVKFTLILSAVSMWVFRIGCSVVFGVYLDMGVFGIWVAMGVDWLFRGICFTIRYVGGKWKHASVV